MTTQCEALSLARYVYDITMSRALIGQYVYDDTQEILLLDHTSHVTMNTILIGHSWRRI